MYTAKHHGISVRMSVNSDDEHALPTLARTPLPWSRRETPRRFQPNDAVRGLFACSRMKSQASRAHADDAGSAVSMSATTSSIVSANAACRGSCSPIVLGTGIAVVEAAVPYTAARMEPT